MQSLFGSARFFYHMKRALLVALILLLSLLLSSCGRVMVQNSSKDALPKNNDGVTMNISPHVPDPPFN